VAAALLEDDLDRALELGLLDAAPCPGCDAACRMRVAAARDARQQALAARERYRARQARLARRAEERAARRADAARSPSALPPAAAAALARATARARKP
jgi:hypothetical protein